MAATGSAKGHKPPIWKHFRKELRRRYELGDAYDDAKRVKFRNGPRSWINDETPKNSDYKYLAYVESLVDEWPHLQLLVDFMQAGTMPMRWHEKLPKSNDGSEAKPETASKHPAKTKKEREEMEENDRQHLNRERRNLDRKDRALRSKVTLLTCKSGEIPRVVECTVRSPTATPAPDDESSDLHNIIQRLKKEKVSGANTLNLFVVEDLSVDVIELLGSGLSIDPLFFRSHLVDYAWNNIRDPWREPPVMDIVSRKRDWMQIRFFRSRYFDCEEELLAGQKEPYRFNVERRLDFDENEGWWDNDPEEEPSKPNERVKNKLPFPVNDAGDESDSPSKTIQGKVALMRTRASLWASKDGKIAVLLLDPTIKGGHPLWRGCPNWKTPQSFDEFESASETTSPSGQSSEEKDSASLSWYDHFLRFATQPDAFDHCPSGGPLALPLQALLHLICAEWLTMTDYINARLNQIDWEIARPDYFSPMKEREYALEKLHIWRRLVPLCRQMLGETLRRGFRTDSLLASLSSDGASARSNRKLNSRDGKGDGGKSLLVVLEDNSDLEDMSARANESSTHPVLSYERDYRVALSRMQEYQQRIDCLTAVVTAAISIEDAQRSFRNSKNIGHLTILATLFIPPSFYATLFSMTSDPLSEMAETFKWWAVASFPTIFILIVLSLVLRRYSFAGMVAATSQTLRQWKKKKAKKAKIKGHEDSFVKNGKAVESSGGTGSPAANKAGDASMIV